MLHSSYLSQIDAQYRRLQKAGFYNNKYLNDVMLTCLIDYEGGKAVALWAPSTNMSSVCPEIVAEMLAEKNSFMQWLENVFYPKSLSAKNLNSIYEISEKSMNDFECLLVEIVEDGTVDSCITDKMLHCRSCKRYILKVYVKTHIYRPSI